MMTPCILSVFFFDSIKVAVKGYYHSMNVFQNLFPAFLLSTRTSQLYFKFSCHLWFIRQRGALLGYIVFIILFFLTAGLPNIQGIIRFLWKEGNYKNHVLPAVLCMFHYHKYYVHQCSTFSFLFFSLSLCFFTTFPSSEFSFCTGAWIKLLVSKKEARAR